MEAVVCLLRGLMDFIGMAIVRTKSIMYVKRMREVNKQQHQQHQIQMWLQQHRQQSPSQHLHPTPMDHVTAELLSGQPGLSVEHPRKSTSTLGW